MGDTGGEEGEEVRALLAEVQLGQFFTRIRDDLQVCYRLGDSRRTKCLHFLLNSVICLSLFVE